MIIENVKSAPWSNIQNIWESIGYRTQVALVDSKNFYIPQTRQRGYMIAFDRFRAQKIGFDVETAAASWVDTMKELQQRASAPFLDMILADDDPRLEHEIATIVNARPRDYATDWEACRTRHETLRFQGKLGMRRPLTRWQTNGTCAFPDFAFHLWAKSQAERIWDSLDINLLRLVSDRQEDLNFKALVHPGRLHGLPASNF